MTSEPTFETVAHRSPEEVWQEMRTGNDRFMAGSPQHPRQDVDHREATYGSQYPIAAIFGCSDSRLAAEIIFDKGLGDLFVVRNAGHVVAETVVGSLEYAVAVLNVSLIVVLSHDACGAVMAAVTSQVAEPAELPPTIASLIRPIVPAVQSVWLRDHPSTPFVDVDTIDPFEVGSVHLQNTVAALLRDSTIISQAVAAGTLAIVGANYRLREGLVVPSVAVGQVDITL